MSIWKRIAIGAFITVLVLTLLSFVNGGALTAFLLILLMSSIYAYVVAMISEPFIAYLTGVSTFTVSIIALVLLDMGIFNGGILAVLAMGFVVFAGWAAFGSARPNKDDSPIIGSDDKVTEPLP